MNISKDNTTSNNINKNTKQSILNSIERVKNSVCKKKNRVLDCNFYELEEDVCLNSKHYNLGI